MHAPGAFGAERAIYLVFDAAQKSTPVVGLGELALGKPRPPAGDPGELLHDSEGCKTLENVTDLWLVLALLCGPLSCKAQ